MLRVIILLAVISLACAETGICSWYGAEAHGHLTANGERFDMNAMTAAHKSLPFNTNIRVRNLDNGRSVVVRINDRGPFTPGRIVDLSRAAFSNVENLDRGVFKCTWERA